MQVVIGATLWLMKVFKIKITANIMNEKFINIKVDREERPDLDNVFQKV